MSKSVVEFCSVASLGEGCQRSSTQHLRKVGKYDVAFFSVCGPKFMKCWESIKDPSQLRTPFTVVYGMFLSEDIRIKCRNRRKND